MSLENEIEGLAGIKIGAAMETREILLYERFRISAAAPRSKLSPRL